MSQKYDEAEILRYAITSIRPKGADVRHKRLALQIPAGRHRRHYVKARVRVHEYPDSTMAVFHGPRCLARYHADGQPIDSQTREAA